MKTVWRVFAFALAAGMVLCGCTPESLQQYKGTYSFNTGGQLSVYVERAASGDSVEAVSGSFKMPIEKEWGQMNVVVKDKKEAVLLVSMNIFRGEAYAADAYVEDGELVLEPRERMISIQPVKGVTVRIPVTVSGSGKIYDNVLLLDMEYEGEIEEAGVLYRIEESDIQCVAQKND